LAQMPNCIIDGLSRAKKPTFKMSGRDEYDSCTESGNYILKF